MIKVKIIEGTLYLASPEEDGFEIPISVWENIDLSKQWKWENGELIELNEWNAEEEEPSPNPPPMPLLLRYAMNDCTDAVVQEALLEFAVTGDNTRLVALYNLRRSLKDAYEAEMAAWSNR